MNSTLAEQTTDQYNESVTAGFTEILLSSSFVSYSGSATVSDYNETSIVLLLSTTSGDFVSRSNGRSGSSSSELLTGITVSSIICIIILLIVVTFIIWRCRAVPQQSTPPAVDRLEAHKYESRSSARSATVPVTVTKHSCTCQCCTARNKSFSRCCQLNIDNGATAQNYDEDISSRYGSQLHLVPTDYNELPVAVAMSSVNRAVSGGPSCDESRAVHTAVGGNSLHTCVLYVS